MPRAAAGTKASQWLEAQGPRTDAGTKDKEDMWSHAKAGVQPGVQMSRAHREAEGRRPRGVQGLRRGSQGRGREGPGGPGSPPPLPLRALWWPSTVRGAAKHPPDTGTAILIACAGRRAQHASGPVPRPHGLVPNTFPSFLTQRLERSNYRLTGGCQVRTEGSPQRSPNGDISVTAE